jgi:hypothetical protein
MAKAKSKADIQADERDKAALKAWEENQKRIERERASGEQDKRIQNERAKTEEEKRKKNYSLFYDTFLKKK